MLFPLQYYIQYYLPKALYKLTLKSKTEIGNKSISFMLESTSTSSHYYWCCPWHFLSLFVTRILIEIFPLLKVLSICCVFLFNRSFICVSLSALFPLFLQQNFCKFSIEIFNVYQKTSVCNFLLFAPPLHFG